AVRGRYYKRYRSSTNIMVLDPDVSDVFPNADSVNEPLRALAAVVRVRVPVPKRSSSTKNTKPGRRPRSPDAGTTG
ncbi:MAG TPA: hypothetical protein VJU18_01895, partial [Vicinamibacteria bacterium]|nr:hypothetical protein [Vicinamibacteria bacterium]